MKKIVSSNLDAAEYDTAKRELIVRFKNGSAFRYFRVMPGLYKKFEALFDGTKESAGKFFSLQIRGLECEKIEDWK